MPSLNPKEDNYATAMSSPKPNTSQPIRVMIYRGKNSTEECPESVARLFKSTFPSKGAVKITYAGPDERVQINANTLSRVDVFAQGGGPGM